MVTILPKIIDRNISSENPQLHRNIYRIIPVQQFLFMLRNSNNTLVSPKCWEDPYEKIFTRCKIITGTFGKKELRWNEWYCQCWSLFEESDSLWRSFTHNKEIRCVKIKSTIAQLIESFEKININTDVFVGEVYYSEEENYVNSINHAMRCYQEQFNLGIQDLGALSMQMCKRNAFESEHELRVLAHRKGLKRYSKVWSYTLDINKLSQEISFDPWTPSYDRENYKKLLTKLRYIGNISFSELYKEKGDLSPEIRVKWNFKIEPAKINEKQNK